MADDDRLLKARIDGSRAKALLADETLQAAFTEMKRGYAEKLFSTSISETVARETLYQAHRLVGEIERHLQHVLDNGKLADAELNSMIRQGEAKKSWASIQ